MLEVEANRGERVRMEMVGDESGEGILTVD